MKIGIITYNSFSNYGTMLQAFALQKAIEKLGCDCDYIDCMNYYPQESFFKAQLKRMARIFYYIKNMRATRNRHLLDKKGLYFHIFYERNFKRSKQSFKTSAELLSSNIELEYDIFITGSDQVFSTKIGLNPALFLDFVKDNKKKRAYAPSVGISNISVSDGDFLRTHLDSYEYLSCREISGSNILKKYTSKEITTVIDPTLLLSASDWTKYCTQINIIKPYLLCYFIGERDYYRIYSEKLAAKLQLQIIYIPMVIQDLKNKEQLFTDGGPSEFLSLIKGASFVCTDSFHGTCFSINFRKDFYVFTKVKGSEGSGDNSRIYDILNRLNLRERLKSEEDKVIFEHIDYTKTEPLLESEIKKSLQYLNKIISL